LRKDLIYLAILAIALIFIFKDCGINALSIIALIAYVGLVILLYLKSRRRIEIPLATD